VYFKSKSPFFPPEKLKIVTLTLAFRLFFVIEFVRGGDLMFHMQRQRRLPEEHARQLVAKVL
jgi:hypothetical protein